MRALEGGDPNYTFTRTMRGAFVVCIRIRERGEELLCGDVMYRFRAALWESTAAELSTQRDDYEWKSIRHNVPWGINGSE
jgi:hypothetical protein